jgi:acetolactate synthase-1/2/3 large subunit
MPAREAVAGLQEALKTSRRPLVITGLTFTRSKAAAELLRFIERQRVPLITTLHAKGMLPESHSNWCGVLGRARRSDVQRFVSRADLIIAVGYDPIEINYEEWVGNTPVVHVSTEEAEGFGALVNYGGNMDGVVQAMADLPAITNDWGLLAYDVGAHTHQIATQWRTDLPGTCLATNGWSSMGFGMPAAYAAKMVYPDRTVVGVVGDGCFQMTAGELALASTGSTLSRASSSGNHRQRRSTTSGWRPAGLATPDRSVTHWIGRLV